MHRVSLFLLLLGLLVTSSRAQAQIPSAEDQIGAAIMAAPDESRAGATVLGYTSDGTLRTLREGSNELICLADDPTDDQFSVACYHSSLAAFMARGRELRAQGMSRADIQATREAEARDGTLEMPSDPASLYVLTGDGYDPATNTVANAYLRYVIHVPYATAASTGLPTAPTAPGMPWIMDEGRHRAHIMITPPRSQGN